MSEPTVKQYQDILLADILRDKERILQQRIKERIPVEIDLSQEYKRRFPRIVKECFNNEEHYYYNDGTENGLHLISFFLQTGFDKKEYDNKFTVTISYK